MLEIGLLESQIRYISANPVSPILVTKFSASRDSSLATGTSGLELALSDNPFSGIDGQSLESCFDIFSAQFEFGNGKFKIIGREFVETNFPLEIGDLFVGRCNLLWTELVLGTPISSVTYSNVKGRVQSIGLGHGELIRDFARWMLVNPSKKIEFETSEHIFDSNGWCNGSAGHLSIAVLTHIFGSRKIDFNFIQDRFDSILDSIDLNESSDFSLGLCHGVSGVLVSLAGVARFIGDIRRLRMVQLIFNQVFTRSRLLNTLELNEVDCSWLTGAAGIVWAYKVIQKQPTFNPIAPFDSSCFSRN